MGKMFPAFMGSYRLSENELVKNHPEYERILISRFLQELEVKKKQFRNQEGNIRKEYIDQFCYECEKIVFKMIDQVGNMAVKKAQNELGIFIKEDFSDASEFIPQSEGGTMPKDVEERARKKMVPAGRVF